MWSWCQNIMKGPLYLESPLHHLPFPPVKILPTSRIQLTVKSSLGSCPRSSQENSSLSFVTPIGSIDASAPTGVCFEIQLLLIHVYKAGSWGGGQRTHVLLFWPSATPRRASGTAEGLCHLRTKCGWLPDFWAWEKSTHLQSLWIGGTLDHSWPTSPAPFPLTLDSDLEAFLH